MAKPDASNFRRWLVGKVSESRWPVYTDDTDQQVAERIGVQVSVLEEARVVLKERTTRERLPDGHRLGMPRSGARPADDRYRAMFFLEPPKEIYEEWVAIRDRRELTNAVLLRSVCHHVLRLTTQPGWVAETTRRAAWNYKGKWLGQREIRAHHYRIKCELNEACYRALATRAEHTGTLPSAIGRWGVCLLVAGKLEDMVVVSSLNTLYKDPARYCLNPQITR